jgi:hypothetical protein
LQFGGIHLNEKKTVFVECTLHSLYSSQHILLSTSLDNPYATLVLLDLVIFALCWPVPGVIGCLQALEVIKVATGVGEPLCGRMLLLPF